MIKQYLVIVILLVILCMYYFSTINVTTTYKRDIKILKSKADSLSEVNERLKKVSDKLDKEIKEINSKGLVLDSILKVQEKNIYYLSQEKKKLIQQRDNLKNDISKIIDADSTTINSYRSKYFGM